MMNSFVGSDAEAGGQYLASASSNSASGTFRPFSPARRLFCLLTAFDFLAALVIWILYAHVSVVTIDCHFFKDRLYY